MVADSFKMLGLPRVAALRADEVRGAFQKAAAAVHPDGAQEETERLERTGQFTALNEAAGTLTSVRGRLRHLLELEYPELAALKSGAVMDDAMMRLFATTGEALGTAAFVTKRRQSLTTALVRALHAGEEMRAQEQLEAALQQVDAERAALEKGLPELDAARAAGLPNTGERLTAAAARAGFLEKWQAQLRAAFAGFFGD